MTPGHVSSNLVLSRWKKIAKGRSAFQLVALLRKGPYPGNSRDLRNALYFMRAALAAKFLVAPPPYIVHSNPALKDGFGDWGFLLKYRIVAANEEHGNYILTAFFQATFPTGQYKNGSSKAIITPTIAYGKGFGRFDIQGTFGATLPTGNEAKIGRTFPWNNAFQYHVSKKLWPEIETNYTRFQDGPNRGKTQVFMTPGILFGNFHVGKRLSLNFGGGFQVATTRFHVNNHNGIFTVRFPF